MIVPFSFEAPTGIEATLLFVYLLVGVLGFATARAVGDRPLSGVVAVHAGAAVLSVFAADLVMLLVSWELLTLSAYVVIRRGGTMVSALTTDGEPRAATPRATAARAGYWYVAAQIIAAALFFAAIVVHTGAGGTLAVRRLLPAAQPLIVVAILIKTAMMPFHGWLVGSYTRAGFVGSVVLSAYGTKVGVHSAARLVEFHPASVPVVSIVGAVIAVTAVVFALRQHSARRLLSFHIVSQVGYMVAAAGMIGATPGSDTTWLAVFVPEGVTDHTAFVAALFHAGNHIIYKALLFLVAAVAAGRLGHDDLLHAGDAARRLPLLLIAAVIGAASITGLPFTSGYVSKELIKTAIGPAQSALLTIASVGTGLSFIKFVVLLFRRRGAHTAGDARLAPAAAIAMTTLAVLSIAIGVAPRMFPGVPAHEYYSRSALIAGTYPALISFALWMLVGWRIWVVSAEAPSARNVPDRSVGDPLLRTVLTAGMRPVVGRLRRVHSTDAQVAIGVAAVGTLAIIALFLAV